MTGKIKMAIAAGLLLGATTMANASTIPVDADYSGTYGIGNAFDGHGLWLPGIGAGGETFDHTWSVDTGQATYDSLSGALDIVGGVSNTSASGGDFKLTFSFSLTADPTHTGPLICGGGQECNSASADERENIVYFDGDASGKIGTISGAAALAGLEYDVFINKDGSDKLGQLGFGGNWTTLDFGYSNWFTYSRTDTSSLGGRANGHGDINLDFLDGDGMTISSAPPVVPLPAGMPLLLTALAGLAWVRRKPMVG